MSAEGQDGSGGRDGSGGQAGSGGQDGSAGPAGSGGAVERVRDGVLSALTGLVGEVSATDDGSLSFQNEGCMWSVRVVELAAGLEMVSTTCVLAWDVDLDDALRGRVDEARRLVQFGSVELVDRGAQADLLLQYVFPAGGLAPAALTTMLLLVLGGAADARELALG